MAGRLPELEAIKASIKEPRLHALVREYSEETVQIGTRTYKLSALSEIDSALFAKTMDYIVSQIASPLVYDIVVRRADIVLDLVRMVNTETKQGFKGVWARGKQLTIKFISPDELLGTGVTTWLKTYTSTGWTDWAYSSSSPKDVGEEEGYIILGFVDLVEDPKIDAVKMYKDGDNYVPTYLSWDFHEDTRRIYAQELPEAWLFPPESSFAIRAHVRATGSDKLVPIGFRVLEAENLISL